MSPDRTTGIAKSPKQRVRRTPKQAREHILDVAATQLKQKGLGAFNLADIAAAAGYSRGTLLVYFGSVASLKEQLFRRMVRRLEAQLAGLLSRNVTPEEYAEAASRTIFKALACPSNAFLVAWLEISADSKSLEFLSNTIGRVLDAGLGNHADPDDVLKDRILLIAILAIGTGLCGGSIAESVGRTAKGVPRLAESLLQDAAALRRAVARARET